MKNDNIFRKIARQPSVVQFWSDRSIHLFAADAPGDVGSSELDIRINSMEHVERFEQTVSWQTRSDFISAARDRIEKGETLLFTVADSKGPLLGYGLAHPNALKTTYTYVGQRVIWPEKSATIYGGYMHPIARGKGIHSTLIKARIHHLIDTLGMQWVVSGVVDDNEAALRSSAKTNLHPIAVLNTRRRFGRATMTAECFNPAFNSSFVDAKS